VTHRLPSPGAALVGVDVGGTKVAVLVVSPDGRAIGKAVAPSTTAGGDALIAVIESTVQSALQMAQLPLRDVAMLGVGIPGRVDPDSGHVELALNLNLSGFPLSERLEDRLGRPSVVENDVRAAAFGLHVRGITTPAADLAYLSVGSGIAAGLVLDGHLYRGARGLAGEIGHAIINPGGERCGCGQRGCLEAEASGLAIGRRAEAGVRDGHKTSLRELAGSSISARDVYAAAAQGDPLGLAIADHVGRRLASAVHLLVMTCDVERVFIGGGVSHAGEAFSRPLRSAYETLRSVSVTARELLRPDVIEILSVDAEPGVWGAVAIAAEAWKRLRAEGAPGIDSDGGSRLLAPSK
jgi:glucokinase